MQRLEVSGAVRLIYKSLGVKGLIHNGMTLFRWFSIASLIRRQNGGDMYSLQKRNWWPCGP